MNAGSSWLKEDSGAFLRKRAWYPAHRIAGQLPLPHELQAQPQLPIAATRALERMVDSVCTDKQKALLAALAQGPLPPTRAIRIVSRQLDCAESSVWSALAKLKEFGLVAALDGQLRLVTAEGA